MTADIGENALILLEPFWNILNYELASDRVAGAGGEVEIVERYDSERHLSSVGLWRPERNPAARTAVE